MILTTHIATYAMAIASSTQLVMRHADAGAPVWVRATATPSAMHKWPSANSASGLPQSEHRIAGPYATA